MFKKMRSKIIIGIVGIFCLVVLWIISQLYKEVLNVYEETYSLMTAQYSWFFRLLLNITGYAIILVPMFLVYMYIEKTNYFDKISNNGCMYRTLFACYGEPNERLPESLKPQKIEQSPTREGLELAFCFTGLMTSYLIWGLLQEKIMTQEYVTAEGESVQFRDSQFLVFVNRLLALLIALALLARSPAGPEATPSPPLYKFSYCALTNVLSAWCQYEALKYVSFPTQVLSKSCKVVPVMLMGRLVSGTRYPSHELASAALISIGMALFLLGVGSTGGASAVSGSTTLGGAALLALYMCADSFTATWQGELFTQYGCRPLRVLCGVNLFSCLLTAAALLHNPATLQSLHMLTHPIFLTDCIVLSLSSALGQLMIYRTIANFGPVVFTIIMTLRQATSILASCAVYGHTVGAAGMSGVVLVLSAVVIRLYPRLRMRR